MLCGNVYGHIVPELVHLGRDGVRDVGASAAVSHLASAQTLHRIVGRSAAGAEQSL